MSSRYRAYLEIHLTADKRRERRKQVSRTLKGKKSNGFKRIPSSFLFLVVRPGALIASLLLVAMPGTPSSLLFIKQRNKKRNGQDRSRRWPLISAWSPGTIFSPKPVALAPAECVV